MGGTGDIYELSSFLPGRLTLQRGRAEDYRRLERFHYRRKRPATWADVWTIRYEWPGRSGPGQLVGVGVLSYPTLALHIRERVLGLTDMTVAERERFVNANLRTISRVAVHPTFRSIGLAVELVRCLIRHCPTRYVEALAVMGRAHGLFARAGMREYVPGEEGRPVYYLREIRNPKLEIRNKSEGRNPTGEACGIDGGNGQE